MASGSTRVTLSPTHIGAETASQTVAQHHVEFAGGQLLQLTLLHVVTNDRNLALGPGLDAIDHGPGHIAAMAEHAFQLDKGRHRFNLVVMIQPASQRLPVLNRLTPLHGQMSDHAQDAGLQFPVEAIHNGKNRDQYGNPQHQTQCGNQRNHGNKTVAGAGAGVAQPHIKG